MADVPARSLAHWSVALSWGANVPSEMEFSILEGRLIRLPP